MDPTNDPTNDTSITATFSDPERAQEAVRALQTAGFANEQIAINIRDAGHGAAWIAPEPVAGWDPPAAGLGAGGVIGGAIGAAITFLIPGLGPAIGGTPTGGGVIGLVIGGIIGAIVGFLAERAGQASEAHHAVGTHGSFTTITVRPAGRADQAARILRDLGGADVGSVQGVGVSAPSAPATSPPPRP